MLEALFAAPSLVSAEHIAAGTDTGITLDVTSVYRNLERLEQLGVVRHVHVGHGPSVYGLIGEASASTSCARCAARSAPPTPSNSIACAPSSASEFGFEARFTHFPIHGRCADCSG